MKIGIFGGSFDPPHYGHICAANAFITEINLDKLLIVPVPSYKIICADSGCINKLKMCELSFGAIPKAEIWPKELLKGSFSYTVELLEEISTVYEGSELFFLIGADILRSISCWHRSQDIFTLAEICCAARGENMAFVQESIKKATALGAKICMLHSKMPDISSSKIREILRKKQPISGMVTSEVEAYIYSHAVYKY